MGTVFSIYASASRFEKWIPMSVMETETGEQDPGESVEEELDRDDIFHILQCRRRRLVLKYLQEYDGEEPAAMSDIAEHIAARENETTVETLRSQERQRVYIALYQSHLPKMDKVGVIDYEQYRGIVKPTELTEEFERYLFDEPSLLSAGEDAEPTPDSAEGSTERTDQPDVEDEQSPQSEQTLTRWSRRYLYATGGALVALSAGFMGLLPQLWIATLVTGMFALLGVTQALDERSSSQPET